MKNIHLFISALLFSFIFLVSCEDTASLPTQTFQVDNPLSNGITIQIDDGSYDIAPTSNIDVALEYGKHTLTYNGGSVNFVVKQCSQPVVMNPTLSNYILYHKFYFDANQMNKAEAEYEKIREAYMYDFDEGDMMVSKVPFKVISSLFIELYEYYWDYGINTPLATVAIAFEGTTNLSMAVKSKLFRANEFLAFAKETLEYEFSLPQPEIKSLSELKPFNFNHIDRTFDCPEGDKYVAEVISMFDSLPLVKGKEFVELYNKMFRYGYSDREKEALAACADEDGDNSGFLVYTVALGKTMEKMGEMNAFVVK